MSDAFEQIRQNSKADFRSPNAWAHTWLELNECPDHKSSSK